MTIEKLKNSIEIDFAWLTPDEKQKLLSLLKSNWNSAIDTTSKVLNNDDNISNLFYKNSDTKFEFKEALDSFYKPIKNLKL